MLNSMIAQHPELTEVINLEPMLWLNPKLQHDTPALWASLPYQLEDIQAASARLERFAPLIAHYFPETKQQDGIIESELRRIDRFAQAIQLNAPLYLKMDSHLAVAGSIKARGGIYEVLYFAEQLALEAGFIRPQDNYIALAEPEVRQYFNKYTLQVGSTGNLGLSIGISAAALGFKVIVHMSRDAQAWKKDLLRSKGVQVEEYDGDFTLAVETGRKAAEADPYSYFIDDEQSVQLFMGYAVAALRLQKQLEAQAVTVDLDHPLFVYLPCGVGGSPGGVAYGLKRLFGDACHIFFIEPTHAPSMLIGMTTEQYGNISVQDVGIDGRTEADGLAVGRPSSFIGQLMDPLLSGIVTVEDTTLFDDMKLLNQTESIQIEPSACSTFAAIDQLHQVDSKIGQRMQHYIQQAGIASPQSITHLCWATGGALVPQEVMKAYLSR